VRHDSFSQGKKVLYRLTSGALKVLATLVVGRGDVFDLNDRAVAIKGYRSCGFYTRYTSRMYETKRRFDKEKYDVGYADICFRGCMLMSVRNADQFLREMYGRYEAMPPEAKRVPEHGLNMFDSPPRCIRRFN
jgi:hypothetical protein